MSNMNQPFFFPKTGNIKMDSSSALKYNANENAVQQWFSMLQKCGGCRGIRKEFIRNLKYFESNESATVFRDNMKFNRYWDVPLLDASRIKLCKGPEGHDYIHASIVTGAEFPIICAQGPVDESIERFWIMVVERKCGVIVQLCQNWEDGIEKCADYIPNSKENNFGNVNVRIREKQMNMVDNPSVRKTFIEASYNGDKVEVTHFLFNGWPDDDVPLSPALFHELRTTVHSLAIAKNCPIIVHCSAGIGRTGTYAAIEIAIKQLIIDNKIVQMGDILKQLRRERAWAIQNDRQFLFVHRAIIDVALEVGRIALEEDRKNVNDFLVEYDAIIARKRPE